VTSLVLVPPPRNVARDGPGPPPGDIGVGLAITLGCIGLVIAVILILVALLRRGQPHAPTAGSTPSRNTAPIFIVIAMLGVVLVAGGAALIAALATR
jgi:hypothetical protein